MLRWLRQLFGTPPLQFDESWRPELVSGFQHWSLLSEAELDRMEMLVTRFMATIDWEAANGFELTDQIKVLIAAQASMLLLGLDLDGYDDVTSVIVHPANVRLRGNRPSGGGTFSSTPTVISGQAHYQGPGAAVVGRCTARCSVPGARPQRGVPRVRASSRHAGRRHRRHAAARGCGLP